MYYINILCILNEKKNMIQVYKNILIKTSRQKIIDITQNINNFVDENKLNNGILLAYILHTSASLLVQENADPDVLKDLEKFFNKLVPMRNKYYHHSEGIDDMPAHIKSVLTNTSLSFSIQNKQIVLGSWQAIYLYEHRLIQKDRYITLHFLGD
tara:strand:- start:669 stop:1130 length:462 start_codon:yes stop_codon:yes gene_type:complete